MRTRAVLDASPLISFYQIHKLDLVQALFDEPLAPPAVARELLLRLACCRRGFGCNRPQVFQSACDCWIQENGKRSRLPSSSPRIPSCLTTGPRVSRPSGWASMSLDPPVSWYWRGGRGSSSGSSQNLMHRSSMGSTSVSPSTGTCLRQLERIPDDFSDVYAFNLWLRSASTE